MPASYFRQTTEEARLQHLGAISAMLEVCVYACCAREITHVLLFLFSLFLKNTVQHGCIRLLYYCQLCFFNVARYVAYYCCYFFLCNLLYPPLLAHDLSAVIFVATNTCRPNTQVSIFGPSFSDLL